MIAPLDGVLGDARRFYRGNAVRLLLIAATLFGSAAGLDVLITVNRWPGGWCDMTDAVAALLLLVIVAARLPARLAGVARPASKPATSVAATALRSAATAAILAALAIATGNAESFAGRLAFLIVLPGAYLMFMWSLAVPVIVIEGAGALTAMRRSWRLIHGNGPRLFLELIKAWAALVAITLIPLIPASDPGLPFPLRMRLLPIVPGVVYGPFAAVALTLIYYRLAEARSAATLDPVPQPES